MSKPVQEIFRLTWRSPIFGWFSLILLPLGVMAWPHVYFMLALVACLAVAQFFMLLLSIISVTDEGIVLYRVNRLEWSQVKAVRRVSFLGLPYLLINRFNGYPWWLPLYFSGARPIEAALADRAPLDSPFHTYATTTNT